MSDKTIIVDVDGVVYDWVAVMATLVSQLGYGSPPALMDLCRTWEVWDDWGIPKGRFRRLWRYGVDRNLIYKEGAPVDGAVNGLWRLSDAGWHIHLVTDRLNLPGLHEKIVANTVAWCAQYDVPYGSLSFTGNKHDLSADVAVDDRAANLNGASSLNMLFPAPHNRTGTLPAEAVRLNAEDPWGDLVDTLAERFAYK